MVEKNQVQHELLAAQKNLVEELEALKIYIDGVQAAIASKEHSEYYCLHDLAEEAKEEWEEEVVVHDRDHSRTMGIVDLSIDLLSLAAIQKVS